MFYILILLVTHWFADFICQKDWQAKNKSKNNIALLRHVLNYTLILAFVSAFFVGFQPAWMFFVLVNGFLHWCTDWVTSRINSSLWEQKRVHDFFVSVGFDQLIHQFCLILTLYLFFGVS
jgi:hypothetical protein